MADTVLVFRLAGHGFALPTACVQECLPLPSLHRRPGLPPHLAGFLELGEAMLPVIDLARLLGLRAPEDGLRLEADGFYRHLLRLDAAVLLVDRALGLERVLPAPFEPDAGRWQHGCVAGWLLAGGEPVALLDPDRLLLRDEHERLLLLTTAARQRRAGWDPGRGEGCDAG